MDNFDANTEGKREIGESRSFVDAINNLNINSYRQHLIRYHNKVPPTVSTHDY